MSKAQKKLQQQSNKLLDIMVELQKSLEGASVEDRSRIQGAIELIGRSRNTIEYVVG